MTYSEDLRKRVVAFVKQGGKKTDAARQFKVSRWCVYDWTKRLDLRPEKAGPKQPWGYNPKQLRQAIESTPDLYQDELAETLGVSQSTISYGLKRLQLSRKKNDVVPSAK